MSVAEWKTAPLPDIIAHIVDTHHAYCRREMARLEGLFRACEAPGAHPAAAVTSLRAPFQKLCAALSQHLAKEEMILFPLITRFARAEADQTPPPQPAFGSVANPIRMMILEHGEAEAVLNAMSTQSAGFTVPAGSSPAVAELYTGLHAFDEDMKTHVQLEDTVLFPRAIDLERALLGG